MRIRMFATLAVAVGLVVAACNLVLVGDMEVNWTISGSTSGSCSTYNIREWEVSISGPEHETHRIPCGTWSTGTLLYGVAETVGGPRYQVSVRALSDSGAQIGQARTESGVEVISSAHLVTKVQITFQPSDFSTTGPVCGNSVCEDTKGETCSSCPKDCGTCTGGAKLNVYWNVNGTVDGTAKGASWDTCAEVGAAYAIVTVDGVATSYDCSGSGNMSTSIAVTEGTHAVKVKLADSSKNAITTETTPKNVPCSAATPGEHAADFYWDSFLTIKNTMKGKFLFATSYEGGKSCDSLTPKATFETAIFYLSGSAVSGVDVCVGASCSPADGTTETACFPATTTQTTSSMLWGDYTLRIQGLEGPLPGDVCWQTPVGKSGKTQIEILVGAGNTNPLVKIDTPRLSTCP